jgi:hypothetical protein
MREEDGIPPQYATYKGAHFAAREQLLNHFRYHFTAIEPSVQLSQFILGKLRSGDTSKQVLSLSGRCCLLDRDFRRRLLVLKALKKGIMCPDWRQLLSEIGDERTIFSFFEHSVMG